MAYTAGVLTTFFAIGALVLPPAGALSVFLALGLGLAFPYLLLSFLPGAHRLLPKPGDWMVTFRQILAFPMFATAVWLLWVLGRQLGVGGMALGLVAIWTLALGVCMAVRFPPFADIQEGRRVSQ